jgi:hypothetical protein
MVNLVVVIFWQGPDAAESLPEARIPNLVSNLVGIIHSRQNLVLMADREAGSAIGN